MCLTSGILCMAIAKAMYGPKSVKEENATCSTIVFDR
jgi:hypothetical protein